MSGNIHLPNGFFNGSMPHLDDQTLRLFLDARLDTEQEEQIEEHLERCPICTERVTQLERSRKDPMLKGLKGVDLKNSGDDSEDESDDHFKLPTEPLPVLSDTVIGNYTILGLLGSGGMGTVYRAINPHLNRPAAIKVIKASRALRPSSAERFQRELLAIGKLRHPNIVDAFDAGVYEDRPYLAMELLEGDDLAHYVQNHGPFPIKEACDIIRQAALGLQHAHEAGLIHRDIKPSNLFRTKDGTVKVLDLGLARLLETESIESNAEDNNPSSSPDATAEGQILGSPDYMSPEQAVGAKNVDVRSDLYSLGCTFFYLLTGTPPFGESTHPELADKIEAHSKQELPPIEQFRKDIPPVMRNLLYRMVAKRQEDRPQSAKEVTTTLDRYLHSVWRKILLGSISALLIPVLAIAHYWDSNREKIQYFADYVDSFGVPQGIFPLTKGQMTGASEHYRFVSSRNKLRRVVHANSAGKPIPHTDKERMSRPIIQELTYNDKDGRLIHTDYRDANARLALRLSYSGDHLSTIDFESMTGNNEATHAWLSASTTSFGTDMFDGTSSKNRARNSNVQRWKLKRNAKGHIERIEFKRLKSNTPAKDGDGVFGFEYRLDELGRVAELWYLNEDGKRMATKLGIAGRKYDYGGANIRQTTYVDLGGKPAYNDIGWAIAEEDFDRHGNPISGRYFGPDGQSVFSKERIAQYKYDYDKRGNLVAGYFFDMEGKPCLHVAGCASYNSAFDGDGNVTETFYFGIDGKPCFAAEHFAGFKSIYDSKGNMLERTYLGVDGKPCPQILGHARVVKRYDKSGNIVEQIHYDPNGNKCVNDGVASFKAEYDDQNNLTRVVYFDVDGKPCMHPAGFASFLARYDERGNITEQRFFDLEGKSCLCIAKYAFFRAEYDENGNQTKQSYFGVDGKPCLDQTGCSVFTTKYDERGNIVRQDSYGIDGNRCARNDGISYYWAEYDRRGNRTKESYFDVDGKPCTREDGCSIVQSKFDEQDRLLEEAYFDINGKPYSIPDSWARGRWQYDRNGSTIEESYFGIDGKPFVCDNGYAGWTAENDERGNPIRISFFDTERNPCTNLLGIASSTMKYDAFGELVEMVHLGLDGKPLEKRPMVTEVVPGGMGEQAGLKVGDFFLQYDGYPLETVEEFGLSRSSETKDASEKELHVLRNGKSIVFKVKPGRLGVGLQTMIVPSQWKETRNEEQDESVP